MLRQVDELEEELPAGRDDYLDAGRLLHRYTERLCQIVVKCATDANGLLLSLLGEPSASSARESFDRVHQLGAIGDEVRRRFCETFVGFRHRLVHDYEQLDNTLVHHAARLLLEQAPRYAAEMASYTREGWEHTEVPVRLRLRLGEYPLSSVCCTPAGEVPRTSTSVCSQPSRVYVDRETTDRETPGDSTTRAESS
ncbi:MAG: hypothetical protein CO096_27575 [Armatimonadetes bacterium CG_4_9_14_3_um_filter_66_14]|nr:MAG: hypothetical protein COS65_11005 [Armatimonadetes bacterium CG06_land_8_20_14_3_00_66_21]PJB61766.1 MAG: hypothetical protein CO096_27575 [Armatimonadetes bacterium CG_4_9_14_3_um_filter_66_14]